MALRSALDRYRTISRPRVGGGQSSYFSSLAKKTQAAEDDVVDHNYQTGLLSAEGYLTELTKRLARPGLTPLQQTNLRQKIEATQGEYNDSVMQNAYKAGQVTDRDMYNYEKEKLSRMTAADGEAFQKQQAKVTGMLDKAQKSERKSFRLNESLRISQLPEDRSDLLDQKASMYKTLWEQAIADGDMDDAKSLETSFNNYTLAAKKAGVSDSVSKVMAEIAGASENIPYYADDGEVSAAGGAVPPANSAGQQGGVGGSSAPSAGTSAGGTAPSGYSDAVGRAQESYRRALIREQNYAQDIGNTQKQITALESAQKQYRAMGAVDQADAVGTQIQNLKNRLADLRDSRAGNADAIAEARSRIGEAQAAAAYQAGYSEYQNNENEILDAEQNLDLMLQLGQIGKDEYLKNKREVVQQKVNLYKSLADLYSQFDKTNPAADTARKAQREELANLRVLAVQQNNPGRFELVQDADGTIKLMDVYSQKTAKTFEQNYVQDGDIWRRVYIPGLSDDSGSPLSVSQAVKEGFAWGSQNPDEMPFVTVLDKNGNLVQKPVVRVDNKNELQDRVQGLIDQGRFQFDPKTGQYTSKREQIGPTIPEIMGNQLKQNVKKAKDVVTGVIEGIPDATKSVLRATSPAYRQSQGLPPYQFVGVDVPDLGKLFAGASDSVTKLLQNVRSTPQGKKVEETVKQSPLEALGIKGANAGNILKNIGKGVGNLISRLTPDVEAGGIQFEKPKVKQAGFPVAKTWDEMVGQAALIAYEYGIPPEVMISQMALESGRGTSNRARQNQLFGVGVYDDSSPGHQYSSPEASMRGYAKLITTDPRYAKALQYRDDPEKFIRAVKAAGYAADPDYVRKIMAMPEFRANYETYRARKALPPLDATNVAPLESENWYDGIVNGVKSLLPGKVEAKGPSPAPAIATPRVSSPAQQAIQASVPRSMATPTLAQTPSSSAQLRTPAPAIKLPSIPSYNPVQTFQSNVQKATSAVKNTASNVVNTVKNALSKLKFW